MSEDMIQAVKRYIARGWVVHPLSGPDDKGNSPGKRPLKREWEQLTETPEDIGAYIKQGCNIGLVCGKVSDVTVLDFDNFFFLEQAFNGFDLKTLRSKRTEGRGHIYFKYNPNLPASKHHTLGIEVLSDGNNAVLAPSVHASGDVYKENGDEIIKMPQALEGNLKGLFKTEVELKQLLRKSRTCFRKILDNYPKNIPDMHGAEGREFMLAVCTDLKAAGATEKHALMFARVIYGKDYDEARTLQEWCNIDKVKTWKCETLKAKLSAFVDPEQCEKCDKRKIEQDGQKFNNRGAFEYIDKIIEETPLYYDKSGQFWLWAAEGFYKQVDTTEILLTLLKKIADPAIIEKSFKSELLEAARLRGRDAAVKPVPRDWIHTENVVYDLKTGEVFESNPDYLFTDPIPHKLGTSEATPTIDKLFSEWVTPEKVQLLHEIAAYCLYNGYPIHRMFVLIGRGRNGKGQYRDFVVNLIGSHNRTASTLEQLINSRFETARLYNKKLCTMGEINYSLLDRTAILKMLSGGDPIPGEVKNKAPFDFVNSAKIIINTNSLPQTTDKTDAFYSRCVLVEFGNQFSVSRDIVETIPEEEYSNFLTKSLRILRELLARGEFSNEGDIRAKEKDYERLSNPLAAFINTYYEQDVNASVAAWQMFEGYIEYCSLNGYRKPKNQRDFNGMLRVDYNLEKKNEINPETPKINKDGYEIDNYVNWVWVRELKKRDLPYLPNLPNSLINTPIDKSYEELGKLGKSGKNSLPISGNNLPNDTIIEVPKSGKLETCGICNKPLNGNSENAGQGLGKIHPACKFTPISLKIIEKIPNFVCIDNRQYGELTPGQIVAIPATNAYALINRKAAERTTS